MQFTLTIELEDGDTYAHLLEKVRKMSMQMKLQATFVHKSPEVVICAGDRGTLHTVGKWEVQETPADRDELKRAVCDAVRWLDSVEKVAGNHTLLNAMPNACMGRNDMLAAAARSK